MGCSLHRRCSAMPRVLELNRASANEPQNKSSRDSHTIQWGWLYPLPFALGRDAAHPQQIL